MSIIYSVAFASLLLFWMCERVNTIHRFSQISTHLSHQLTKLIVVKAFRNPKCYVFIAGRVLGVRLELCDLVLLELVQESRVLAPEESDVLNVKESHGPTLQTQAKCPTDFLGRIYVRMGNDRICHHPTTENLKPFVIEVYFQLERRVCERKMILVPSHLHIPEYSSCQVLQHLLQVSLANDLGFLHVFSSDVFQIKQSDALHLMEAWVMSLIHSILPEDISCHQERRVALPYQRYLVD